MNAARTRLPAASDKMTRSCYKESPDRFRFSTYRAMTDRSHSWIGVGRLGDYQDARICRENINPNVTSYHNHRGRSFLISNGLLGSGSFQITDFDGLGNVNYAPTYYHQIEVDYANRTSAAPVRCVKYDAEK